MTLTPLFSNRALPYLDELNRAFWTGGADGRLHLQRCVPCAVWYHPAVPRCRGCRSADLPFHPTSGLGTVHSFTVNHQQWVPDTAPYVIVLVELDEQEGLRITSNLRNCDLDAVAIGDRVMVAFEQSGDIWVPQFVPATTAEHSMVDGS